LTRIYAWSKRWSVTFNPDKTEYMIESLIISRKIIKPTQPTVYLNNISISEFQSNKHLRITVSQNGNWDERIQSIISIFVLD